MPRMLIVVAAIAAMLAGCTAPTAQVMSSNATPSPSAAAITPPSSASPTTLESSSAPPSTPLTLAGLPRIDGSTANIPLISLMIQRLTGVSKDEADNAVKVSTTPGAYSALLNDYADLLVVYEADAEMKREIEFSDVKIEAHPIGRDALVFFTNATNPVTTLTTNQYRDIYSGKATNWKALGGQDAKIVAYQRPETSGSQALMRKYVMGDRKLVKAPSERITGTMGEIIDQVSSYSNKGNAMGYSVYYYLKNMYAVDGIKMLGVSGVMPSNETIASGQYPYVNDFYAIVRADAPADSPARKALNWLLSPAGRQAVIDAGYVPKG